MPLSDTHPDIERIQIELMRRAPVWRRLDLLGQLNQTLKTLAISGLRQRYPQASQTELQRRLADMILGEELAAKAYGSYSGEHPSSTPPRLP